MLYEYQLAYVSVPHYSCFPFINILLAQAGMCVSCPHAKVSHRHVLLMILIFLSSLSPPSSILSLSLSRCIFITPCTSPIRPPPLDNLSLYLLSGLFTEVSVQSSSSSPPLFLSLSNPLLSFPLQSSVDSCTLRLDQSALRFLSCPLLHSNLVSVFHLEAPPHPHPHLFPLHHSRLFLTPSLPRHSCLRIPSPLPLCFLFLTPPFPQTF